MQHIEQNTEKIKQDNTENNAQDNAQPQHRTTHLYTLYSHI